MDGEDSLVEEREAELVSPTGSRNPIKRKGWFLKPSAPEPLGHTFPPSRPKTISSTAQEVLFKGWRSPQSNWGRWVGKLRPIYGDLWMKAGIFDAIQASTYNIRKDPSSIWGLVSFWCEQTNTFHFPWSEATLTLEDVMILGGFPALGEPIRGREALPVELAEVELKMVAECRRFNQTPSKKAGHYAWMKHFFTELEGEGGGGEELEHIAFLSLWLSRYVFPGYPGDTIGHYVFQIAIRLAGGAMIALAPAVLAAIYRDLRAIKDHLTGNAFVVWAPFNILQLWVWERFAALRPERTNFVGYDEPRAARWHGVGKKIETSFVRSVFKSPGEFNWRPYATNLDDWCRPAFYRDSGEWVCVVKDRNEELLIGSFARCLRACELVGLDCVEQYLPHRVAMQFGFDQDIPPGFVSRAKSTWETYDDMSRKNVMLYIPSCLVEPDVTLRYSIWWKQYMLAAPDAVRNDIGRSRSGMIGKKKRKEVTSLLPKMKKQKFEDDVYDRKLADWMVDLKKSRISGENKNAKSQMPSSEVAEHTSTHMKLKISSKCTENVKQSSDALEQGIEEERAQLGEASASDPLDVEDIEIMDSGDSAVILNGTEGILSQRRSNFNLEEGEESSTMIGKESELDMQIRTLKEEIAVIQATLMALESPDKVHS